MVPVAPGLFLGSSVYLEQPEVLTENAITHIVNVSEYSLKEPDGIFVRNFYAKDEHTFFVRKHFESFFDFAEELFAESKKNRILVSCIGGLSRSPTLCISYLMKKFNYPLEKAMGIISKSRITYKKPPIKPNLGFIMQLMSYEAELFAASGRKRRKKKEFNLLDYCTFWYHEMYPDLKRSDVKKAIRKRKYKRNPLDVQIVNELNLMKVKYNMISKPKKI